MSAAREERKQGEETRGEEDQRKGEGSGGGRKRRRLNKGRRKPIRGRGGQE